MITHLSKEGPLKNRLRQILNNENLDVQRTLVDAVTADLEIDCFTFAAALLHLVQNTIPPLFFTDKKTVPQLLSKIPQPGIKMVRYRLNVGSKHQLTLEGLQKVLIEESGVDKNNINNVNIQSLYTLIELPDEMPPDIFQHLKSVEINQRKLDIRRVKIRNNKKRGNHHFRRGRQYNPKPSGNVVSDKTDSNN